MADRDIPAEVSDLRQRLSALEKKYDSITDSLKGLSENVRAFADRMNTVEDIATKPRDPVAAQDFGPVLSRIDIMFRTMTQFFRAEMERAKAEQEADTLAENAVAVRPADPPK